MYYTLYSYFSISTLLRKFKIPHGAQSAIRGSLDSGSLTASSPLHSSDDSDVKSTSFRQVNSAPDYK